MAARLGVSQHSLYQWLKQFGVAPAEQAEARSQQEENRRLRAELKRVTEERDILRKDAAYFAKESRQRLWTDAEVPLICRETTVLLDLDRAEHPREDQCIPNLLDGLPGLLTHKQRRPAAVGSAKKVGAHRLPCLRDLCPVPARNLLL